MGNTSREIFMEDIMVMPLDSSLLTWSEEEREFLKETISPDENVVKERIMRIQRDQAYAYPCIRLFHFISLMMQKNAAYQRVLEAGKKGDTVLLDIGCCMGTDVRKLVRDGYPESHVLGCDLRLEYITSGYNLFEDKDSCKIRFFTADMFDIPVNAAAGSPDIPLAEISRLSDLANRVTHLYAGALYHLFDEATQYIMAIGMARLTKRNSGTVIFGRHQGMEPEGVIDDVLHAVRYGHSPESWARLWRRVFTELEGAEFAEKRVKVEADFAESFIWGTQAYGVLDCRMMYWSVSIL
ncbi:hypothetical protein FIBSPDRAFT_819000 [Athelia psychrophila]|uniref:Methyltransferase domain-containing protein n=1 Tax=Athelia psychrophila TaxID=1759441 RepID=A0A166Q4T3_9AGAM|nr:hypothetical protein FIBSPDRAFT_819000 [Fibularhizoctonia sp. CBS 109695]